MTKADQKKWKQNWRKILEEFGSYLLYNDFEKDEIWPAELIVRNSRKLVKWHSHGLINNIDTKAKSSHLKNWPVKGLWGRYLSEFIDSHVGIFDTALRPVNPSYLLSDSTLPPPSLCQSTLYTDSVWLVWGCGVLSPVGDHVLCRSLTLCTWPDSVTTKLLDHPKQKLRRGGGLRQINICRKVLYR